MSSLEALARAQRTAIDRAPPEEGIFLDSEAHCILVWHFGYDEQLASPQEETQVIAKVDRAFDDAVQLVFVRRGCANRNAFGSN